MRWVTQASSGQTNQDKIAADQTNLIAWMRLEKLESQE